MGPEGRDGKGGKGEEGRERRVPKVTPLKILDPPLGHSGTAAGSGGGRGGAFAPGGTFQGAAF